MAKTAKKTTTKPAAKKPRAKPLAGKRAPKVTATTRPAGVKMRVAWATVFIAKENPRFGEPVEDLAEIAASMAAHGQLADLIAYQDGKRFAVTDGARRLAGMQEAGGFDEVNIEVFPKAVAAEIGLAAQIERVNLHPAVQAREFAKLLKKGDEPAAIGNRFGVTERRVLQRAALASLHTPIFNAWRKDEIDLEDVSAWGNVEPDRQPALWKRIGKNGGHWYIRQESEKGSINAGDKLAVFVGLDAYREAGGAVQARLFPYRDETSTESLDAAIVDKLAAEKIEALKQRYLDEGWAFAEFDSSNKPYGFFKRAGKEPTTPEGRAGVGVLLWLGKTGQVCVEKNVISERAAEAERRKKEKAKEAKGKPAGDDAPKAEFTNLTHMIATAAASRIVGRSLMAKPGVAVAVVCAALAKDRWSLDAPDLVNVKSPHDWRGDGHEAGLKSDEAAAEMDALWKERVEALLPDEMEAGIANWSMGDQLKLLAYLTGELFIWKEHRAGDVNQGARTALAEIGKLTTADPSKSFIVDREFCNGMSKGALIEACAELGIEAPDKKGLLAEAVAIAAADKAWVPPIVRKITGVEPFEQVKPKRKAKATAKKRVRK